MSEYKIRTSFFLFKLSILWQFVPFDNFKKEMKVKDYTEESQLQWT